MCHNKAHFQNILSRVQAGKSQFQIRAFSGIKEGPATVIATMWGLNIWEQRSLCLKPGFVPNISFGINYQRSRCVTPSLSLIWCAVKHFRVLRCLVEKDATKAQSSCIGYEIWIKGVLFCLCLQGSRERRGPLQDKYISMLKIICQAEVKWCFAAAEQNKIPPWASQ